jgi:hypothetical protein
MTVLARPNISLLLSYAHKKHCVIVIKTSLLMLFRLKISAPFENNKRWINEGCGQKVEFINIKSTLFDIYIYIYLFNSPVVICRVLGFC